MLVEGCWLLLVGRGKSSIPAASGGDINVAVIALQLVLQLERVLCCRGDTIVASKEKPHAKVGLAKALMGNVAIGDFNPRVTFIFGVADGNAGN